jgi:hypothetical protein
LWWRTGSSHIIFRFFETEGIAVMTMLVSRYKVEVKEEPEFAGETFEERYARITNGLRPRSDYVVGGVQLFIANIYR